MLCNDTWGSSICRLKARRQWFKNSGKLRCGPLVRLGCRNRKNTFKRIPKGALVFTYWKSFPRTSCTRCSKPIILLEMDVPMPASLQSQPTDLLLKKLSLEAGAHFPPRDLRIILINRNIYLFSGFPSFSSSVSCTTTRVVLPVVPLPWQENPRKHHHCIIAVVKHCYSYTFFIFVTW